MLSGIRRELDAKAALDRGGGAEIVGPRRSRLERATGQMDALSPLAILERGYALVFDASGKLVKDAARLGWR